jgi:hypothetical protein
MRKVKVLFVALLAGLFITTTAMAATDGLNPESSLRSEIIKLIDHPQQDVLQGQDLTANLRLMVNGENELIVLDTGTNDPLLDSYIKSKLNYKKVEARDINYFKFYFVKMEFKS